MATLNAWQRIDRVIPNKPFGDGSDGVFSSATIPTLTKDSCSGSATSTTLTTSSSTFANGDILLIYQTRGTGVGQWEINKVISGGGSTSLTLDKALQYTYTDSGASQAQACKVLMYSSADIPSGTWSVSGWDGNTGGIFPIAVEASFVATGSATATGLGFRRHDPNARSSGEGTNADIGGSGGNEGGGGLTDTGGGGGHGTAGSAGVHSAGGVTPGYGGSTAGAADLTNLVFGGAGGNGDAGTDCGRGGKGGGAIIIFAKNVVVSGGISVNGNNGNATAGRGGGGGAGGSILIVCETATLGSNLVTALAGAGGVGSEGTGGAAGVGRIAVHHSGTVSGTTSPSFTDVLDNTMFEPLLSFSYAYFM